MPPMTPPALREPARPAAPPVRDGRPCIVHIVEPCEAGVGRHVTDILEGLATCGDFSLALIYSPVRIDAQFAARVARLAERGVRATAVPMARGIAPRRDAHAFLAIVRALRAIRGPLLVHTHSAKAGFLGRLAAQALGFPAIHTPNGLAWKAARRPAVAAAYRSLERLAARWTRCTIAVSHEEARELAVNGVAAGSACTVIENAIPDLRCQRSGALRRELGIPKGSRVVGAVGRVDYQKDPHLFAAVARELLAEPSRRNVHFVWIGGGEDHAGLTQQLRDEGLAGRVHFVGPRADVPEILPDLDVYLLTSRYEGLSYALLEAMRAGLPVVATAVEGAGSVLGDGGVVLPSRDARVIARSVAGLIDDDVALRRVGDASRARFLARYQSSHLLGALRDLYGRLAPTV